MRFRKILTILLIVALTIWGGQTLINIKRNLTKPSKIKRQAESKRRNLVLKFQKMKLKLNDDYTRKKYLATGKTVYDRIYNMQNQTIVELIQKVAGESLPKNWTCEVKAEEFIHFALLVYIPHNMARVEAVEIASYLVPVVKYCGWCLTDVAVFDRMHKSYLFFDNDTLKHIEKEESITSSLLEKVKEQGESFKRFNSTTVQCQKYEQHLLLPLEISGPSGVATCIALFDSGASLTTLTSSIILQTGNEILPIIPKRTFNTANGLMSCPVVHRTVNIGGFRKDIEVAVNQRDEINLLGMNYFKGMKYIVDFQNACIYIWEESKIEPPRLSYDVSRDALDDHTRPQPYNKESPIESAKLSGDVPLRDMNDLISFADEWLEVDRDTDNERGKKD